MKKYLFLVVLPLAGCALTDEERRAVVEESARLAGEQAARLAHERAVASGFDETEAEKVADLARKEAERGAARIAEKAIPRVESEKRGKFGGAIASALLFLLQVAGAATRKGGRA